jgi:hypothetical protein
MIMTILNTGGGAVWQKGKSQRSQLITMLKSISMRWTGQTG